MEVAAVDRSLSVLGAVGGGMVGTQVRPSLTLARTAPILSDLTAAGVQCPLSRLGSGRREDYCPTS